MKWPFKFFRLPKPKRYGVVNGKMTEVDPSRTTGPVNPKWFTPKSRTGKPR